jgi:hypothetical protein
MKESIFVKGLRGELSLTLIFPIKVATELGIGNSDLLECAIEDGRLIITKMDQKNIRDE